jgi:hypothetical protein
VPTLSAPAPPYAPAPSPPDIPAPGGATAAAPLTPARRATLAAVVARVLDGALDLAPGLDAAALVEARLGRAPTATRADLVQVLDVFGSRAAAFATCGTAVPFCRLDAARQDRMLMRWARSRVPVQRTVFQALRRLTLAVWYGHPDVQAAVGHRGPCTAGRLRWPGRARPPARARPPNPSPGWRRPSAWRRPCAASRSR